MNVYRILYYKGYKPFKTLIFAKNEISAINLLFDTNYKDARAFDHNALVSISLFHKG